MDNNVIVTLIVVLINLQNIVATLREKKIMTLFTFNRQTDENIWKFI